MAMWLLHSAELWFAADVYECMGSVRKFAAQSPFCTEGFEEKPRHQTHFRICKSCFGVFGTPDYIHPNVSKFCNSISVMC